MKKYNIMEQFISKEAFSGILLFLSTILAIVAANSPWAQQYYDLWHLPLGFTIGDLTTSMTLTYWIDDGLMALFFLMVGLEIKRELLVGELSSFKKASFPVVAAIGGMVIPALLYVLLNPDNPIGFGIPMATDIAFALGILMLLGKRVNPALKVFLVALAVVDDLGAVMVVATVYTHEIHSQYFLMAGLIYAFIWLLNFKGVKALWPYLLLGIGLWIYIHAIGIHATIAGVLLAFAIPISSKIDEQKFLDTQSNALKDFEKNIDEIPILNHHQMDALENIICSYDKVQNPLLKLEHHLHGLSAYVIMPLFAFSNAGVIIDFTPFMDNIMIVLGVIVGLVIGKPVGILAFTWGASQLKLVTKPDNITWLEVVAIGFLAGIGFTMSIFITHLAFLDEALIAAVKLGVFIASFLAAVIGVIMLLKVAKN